MRTDSVDGSRSPVLDTGENSIFPPAVGVVIFVLLSAVHHTAGSFVLDKSDDVPSFLNNFVLAALDQRV